MAHDLSEVEYETYHALYNNQGARIQFKCDNVTYQGIIDVVLPDLRQAKIRHSTVVEENKDLGNLRFRLSELSNFIIIEPAESVNRFPKNEYISKILRNNVPTSSNTVLKVLYGDELSDKSDEEDVKEEKKEEPFVLDLPKHLESKLPKDYILLDAFNEDFYQAIQHIANQEIIGVSFHGPSVSRFNELAWICMSTEVCLFLFDVHQLGKEAFNEGLRDIFQSKTVKKVMHDCKSPSDCLLHKYATVLTNVFDTYVADFVINMQQYRDKYKFNASSSLDCCLRNYLNIPQEFLFVQEENKEIFYQKRPISNAYLFDLTKSVMYLVLLQEKLSKELLAPLYKVVNWYKNVINQECDEVVKCLGYKLSKPDAMPSKILMYGIQVVRFQNLKPAPSLDISYVNQRTGKIVKIPETSNTSDEMDISYDCSKVNKSKQSVKVNSSKEVTTLSVKPSFREMDEIYHRLCNRVQPHEPMNLINVPTIDYTSTFTVKKSDTVDFNDDSGDGDVWANLRAVFCDASSPNFNESKIKFVPG